MKLLALLLLTSPLLFSQIDLEDKLVAYWNFDNEDALDYSGNENHGIPRGTHSFVEGKFGESIELIGSGWVELPAIDFNSMDDFAISLWVNYTSTQVQGEFIIQFGDHQYGCLGINYHTLRPPVNNDYYLQYSVGSVHYPFGASVFDELIKPVEVRVAETELYNTWNHMLLNYKDGVIYSYLNGELIGSKEQEVRVRNGNAALGAHWWKDGADFSARLDAKIDEVRIYEKCLTDDEIKELFDPADIGPAPCDIDESSSSQIFERIDYTMIKDAVAFDTIVRLTKQDNFQKSAVWSNTKHDLINSFSLKAHISVSEGFNSTPDGSNPGADGFAIIFQNESLNNVGRSGGGIGYEGIRNAVAIELDLFTNFLTFDDPNGYHFAVMVSGEDSLSASHNIPNNLLTKELNTDILTDDSKYEIRIDYFAEESRLILYFGKLQSGVSKIFELTDFRFSDYINLDEGMFSFVGISSATGSSAQRHELHLFNFCGANFKSAPLVQNDDFKVLVNPASDILELSISEKLSGEITIYDYLSKPVLSTPIVRGSTRQIINMSNLPSGAYFIKLKSNTLNNQNSKIYFEKFIKE